MRRLACLLVSVLGCSSPSSSAWRGDARFTASQRADIEAANVWEAERMGVDPIVIEWTHLSGGCERAILSADLPEHTVGTSSPDGCIMVDVSQGADRVGVVFAHELGHVRGMEHHEGPGLMNAVPPATLTWSAQDETACRAEHVCQLR